MGFRFSISLSVCPRGCERSRERERERKRKIGTYIGRYVKGNIRPNGAVSKGEGKDFWRRGYCAWNQVQRIFEEGKKSKEYKILIKTIA